MLLACDVGNSTVKFALFDKEIHPLTHFSFPIGTDAQTLLSTLSPHLSDCSHIAFASVNSSEENRLKKIFQKKIPHCWDVSVNSSFSFINRYEGLVGVDRLCACEAAMFFHPPPLAVFSFGSALVASIVNKNKEFIGGWIFPGIKMSWDVLSEKTALIPSFPFPEKFPPPTPGKSTLEGLSAGIFSAYQGILEKWMNLLKKNFGEITFVSTGRWAPLFSSYLPFEYPHLVLQGIFRIYSRTFK
ncbi:MAG: type III pantothenate kinase [bacterium JZ-2024 1]